MKKFWKPKIKFVTVPAHDLVKLNARVGMLAADDPLWPMLLAVLRKNMETETEACARPNIGDEEAHRARGRVGMLLDLEAQLQKLWADAHTAE